MIFEAGEREIRAKGLDPDKVSYEQVIEGINKLKEQRKSIQAEYRSVFKELSEKEHQLNMMHAYMKLHGLGRDGIDKNDGSRTKHER